MNAARESVTNDDKEEIVEERKSMTEPFRERITAVVTKLRHNDRRAQSGGAPVFTPEGDSGREPDEEVLPDEEPVVFMEWHSIDSDEFIDKLEEWRLSIPLTEKEKNELPVGSVERIYIRLSAMISAAEQQEGA